MSSCRAVAPLFDHRKSTLAGLGHHREAMKNKSFSRLSLLMQRTAKSYFRRESVARRLISDQLQSVAEQLPISIAYWSTRSCPSRGDFFAARQDHRFFRARAARNDRGDHFTRFPPRAGGRPRSMKRGHFWHVRFVRKVKDGYCCSFQMKSIHLSGLPTPQPVLSI